MQETRQVAGNNPQQREYNYAHFSLQQYKPERPSGPQVGQPAPDFAAQTLSGERVHLADFKGQIVVLETGSMTCPVYVGKITRMQQLVSRHPEARFLVLYVREAHPGGRIPQHTSLKQKRRCAERLVSEEGEKRLILVDELDGQAHQAYGLLPDMAYVINAAGLIAYRASWNDPDELDGVLEQLKSKRSLTVGESRKFVPSPQALLRTLRRAGWRAVLDFFVAMPKMVWLHFVKGQ